MNDQNSRRFRALLTALGLSIADAARLIQVSRPLVSRALAGDDRVDAAAVYARLEARLPELVAMRKRPFFDLDGAQIGVVQAAMQRDAA